MEQEVQSAPALREQVAEEVRVAMARRRIKGAKLAAAIGKSEMYVSRRLNGGVAFDLDDLEKIAAVLGVAVADLLPVGARERRPQTTGPSLAQAERKLSRTVQVPDSRPISQPKGGRPADNRPTGRPVRASTAPTSRRPALIGPARRP